MELGYLRGQLTSTNLPWEAGYVKIAGTMKILISKVVCMVLGHAYFKGPEDWDFICAECGASLNKKGKK